MKAVLSNMGFVMQASGLLVFLPIIISFLYKEPVSTIALFLVSTLFLGVGFVLNALCERKQLNYKQSCSLIVFAFVILSIIGSVPYWYVLDGPWHLRLTDAVFESASGFTTTGFSVIADIESLPRSILFYRALTQFIGGIGIVLILLAFFYPEKDLKDLSRSMGFGKNRRVKKAFFIILIVYVSFAFAMILSSIIFGFFDVVTVSSLVLSAISTGGFSPVADISGLAHEIPLNIILLLTMIAGASNFLVLAGLFRFKWKQFLHSEILFFIGVAACSVVIVNFVFGLGIFDSMFHVVSAMSTTGFSYIQFSSASMNLFFVMLMFVGGASLSTAGGIKIFRLVLFFKMIHKAVRDSITGESSKIRVFGKELSNPEIVQSVVIVISMLAAVFVSALLLAHAGYSLVDSLFDSTSAIATVGLTTGIVSPLLAIKFKWMFVALMLLGRVEVFSFLVLFSSAREPRQ